MISKYITSLLLSLAMSVVVGSTLLAAFPEKAIANYLNVDANTDSTKNDEHTDLHKEKHTDKHVDEHTDEHEEKEGHVKLSEVLAKKAGIENIHADSGEIKQTITVYGKTVVEPSAISQIRAPFPGMITQLKVNIGDIVKAGEVIAEIESNDSLKRYTLTSPISGIVTTRHANIGELANEQVLLTIANYDQLWVELRLFPSQIKEVSKGQTVIISSANSSEEIQTESVIKHLLPGNFNRGNLNSGKSSQAFIVARVPLDNTKGQWSPDLLLSGSVVINQVKVPLVVDNRAIQIIEGEQVIFVKNEEGYETRLLTFGESDGLFTHVISGLESGEQYAVKNSYLLKADLEKSSASHHH